VARGGQRVTNGQIRGGRGEGCVATGDDETGVRRILSMLTLTVCQRESVTLLREATIRLARTVRNPNPYVQYLPLLGPTDATATDASTDVHKTITH
jgi:hypothetical protein